MFRLAFDEKLLSLARDFPSEFSRLFPHFFFYFFVFGFRIPVIAISLILLPLSSASAVIPPFALCLNAFMASSISSRFSFALVFFLLKNPPATLRGMPGFHFFVLKPGLLQTSPISEPNVGSSYKDFITPVPYPMIPPSKLPMKSEGIPPPLDAILEQAKGPAPFPSIAILGDFEV